MDDYEDYQAWNSDEPPYSLSECMGLSGWAMWLSAAVAVVALVCAFEAW